MSFLFDEGAFQLRGGGAIDFVGHTIRARLVATTEVLSRSSIAMTGIGIGATDIALAGKSVTLDTVNHRIVYDFNNLLFPLVASLGGGATVNRVVVFKFDTNDAGSTPISVLDLDEAVAPNGGDIACTVPAEGGFLLDMEP